MNRIVRNTIALGALALFDLASATNAQSFVFDRNIGSKGAGNGQLSFIQSVALDSSGNVYAADGNNHRVEEFDSAGGFIRTIGSAGSGIGQLARPQGLALDNSGNLYVADFDNVSVLEFNSRGAFVRSIGIRGNGNGQFISPAGVALDSSGNLYVSDFINPIQEFNSSGAFVRAIGSSGSFSFNHNGNGQLFEPYGITLDSSGNVYVADSENQRAQKFDGSGAFALGFGAGYNGVTGSIGDYGRGSGQLSGPQGIALDSRGNVYVADTGNARIEEYSSSGAFIQTIGSRGAGNGQLTEPTGIAIDGSGNLYVADALHDRIVKFDAVPEPGSFALLFGLATVGVSVLCKRRKG